MTDIELTKLFKETHKKYFSSRFKKLYAEFYPYRSLRHTVEWNQFSIRVKISQHFHGAPLYILEILLLVLLAKVYHLKIDQKTRKIYKEYVDLLQKQLPPKKLRKLTHYNPQGKVFNLKKFYDELNQKYFQNKLVVKNIGWSKNNSYTRIGFYDEKRDLLVISKIFDSKKVPIEVLRYLVYHEMLHIKIPAVRINLRRVVHSKEFKLLEQGFPEFNRINKWIKSNLVKL